MFQNNCFRKHSLVDAKISDRSMFGNQIYSPSLNISPHKTLIYKEENGNFMIETAGGHHLNPVTS